MRCAKGIGRLLAAGLAGLLVLGVARAEDALDTGEEFALEVHRPEGAGPFPAVLLLHGCAGLTSGVRQGLRDHAAVLNEAGYMAVLLDSFSRRDKADGRVCRSLEELGYARFYRVKDVFRAREILAAQPDVDADNFFLIGQSNGGSVALELAAGAGRPADATAPAFRAIVAFYPWCGAIPVSPKLVSPLLVLGAGRDDWVSPEGCRQRAQAATGAPMEVVIYEEARHSFDLPIKRLVYEGHIVEGAAEPTRDSRARILAFFERFLVR